MKKNIIIALLLVSIQVISAKSGGHYLCVTNKVSKFEDAQFLYPQKSTKALFESENKNTAIKECTNRANEKGVQSFAVYKHNTYGPLIGTVSLKYSSQDGFQEKLSLTSKDKDFLSYQRGKTYGSQSKNWLKK